MANTSKKKNLSSYVIMNDITVVMIIIIQCGTWRAFIAGVHTAGCQGGGGMETGVD